MQAVARFGECEALLQRINPEKSELCLSAETQSKLQGVLAGFARAAQCCQRGAAWLDLLNVTRMWWNCSRLIFNKVSYCLQCCSSDSYKYTVVQDGAQFIVDTAACRSSRWDALHCVHYLRHCNLLHCRNHAAQHAELPKTSALSAAKCPQLFGLQVPELTVATPKASWQVDIPPAEAPAPAAVLTKAGKLAAAKPTATTAAVAAAAFSPDLSPGMSPAASGLLLTEPLPSGPVR